MERKVITVFLASPGDLQDERSVARDVVERINKIYARKFGWQVDLVGWEDTRPGFARPQDVINREVDVCHVFVGMLWRKWGTPTNLFSSGFEEEFVRARERHRGTQSPDIWLLFKSISEDSRNDPGEQLKRVLEFRKEQEDKKELFFREFENTLDFGKQLEEYLVSHLAELITKASSAVPQETTSATPQSTEGIKEAQTTNHRGAINDEIKELLQHIIEEVPAKGLDQIDLTQRTRLHLLAASWFSSLHIQEVFETHDINLVYKQRLVWNLTSPERTLLVRTAIADQSETRPGWFWMKSMNAGRLNAALWNAAASDRNEDVRRGAFELVTTYSENNSEVLIAALNDENEDTAKSAVSMIRRLALPEFKKILPEFAYDPDVSFRAEAFNALVELEYQSDPDGAFQLLIEKGEGVPLALRSAALSGKLKVSTNVLVQALASAATPIRKLAAESLLHSKQLPRDAALTLLNDPDSQLRAIGVRALIDQGEDFDYARLNSIFPPKRAHASGLLGGIGLQRGVSAFELVPYTFARKTAKELVKQLTFYGIESAYAYHELATNHFPIIESQIRTDLQDQFESLRKKEVQAALAFGVDRTLGWEEETIKFMRAEHTAAALKGLGRHGSHDDIKFARDALDGSPRQSVTDESAMDIVARFGDFSDVERLRSLMERSYGPTRDKAVRAIIEFSRNRGSVIAELVQHKNIAIASLAARTLLEIEPLMAEPIGLEAIGSKLDVTRKLGVAILSAALPESRLEAILNSYLDRSPYYYNVIFWLDRVCYALVPFRDRFRMDLHKFLGYDAGEE